MRIREFIFSSPDRSYELLIFTAAHAAFRSAGTLIQLLRDTQLYYYKCRIIERFLQEKYLQIIRKGGFISEKHNV
jgi:hypothetical protein